MATKSKKLPTPQELLAEVKGQAAAKTYAFEDYIEVIDALQKKDHSYAEIAAFLNDRLGFSATRGQVYRALQLWRAEKEAEQLRAEGIVVGVEPDSHEFESEAEAYERESGQSIREFMEEHYLKADFPNPAVSHYGILKAALQPFEDRIKAEKEAAEADEAKGQNRERSK